MSEIITKFIQIWAVGFFAWLIFAIATCFIVGSLLLSVAKVATDSCDKRWPIEKVLSGNWMCEK